jgi:hypothetical protein
MRTRHGEEAGSCELRLLELQLSRDGETASYREKE